jgi:hypothetical protein
VVRKVQRKASRLRDSLFDCHIGPECTRRTKEPALHLN